MKTVIKLFAGVFLLLGLCCMSTPTATLGSGEYTDDFISCWDHFDTTYCYFPSKGVDWQYCYQKYLSLAMEAQRDDDFLNVLMDMLAELRDAHVHIATDEGYFFPWSRDYEANYSNAVSDSYFEAFGGVSYNPEGMFSYCCSPKISYFRISSWPSNMNTQEFQHLFDSLAINSEAVIIDVRMNGGGNSSKAFEVAQRFADRERAALYVQFRDGPDHDDFCDYIVSAIFPGGHQRYTGPVYVLQGRGVASSTEMFLCYMGVIPSVTTVGERSYGASGCPVYMTLPNGWQVKVPTWIDYTADMVIIEWTGIEPDVYIDTTLEDFNSGVDPILDFVFSECGLL
ncbi:MAG: hypothetical protein K8S62_08130 [Candidatus Sabulitectum sp.]|nr:hypothetical protein [Candidatus Sabulitectum sp.]